MGLTKLPVPIFYNGKKYSTVDISEIDAGIIADTKKVMDKGNTYSALKTFLAGTIISIDDITDIAGIRNLIGYLPYVSAIFLAVKILSQGEDGGIEGVYPCPRCGEKVIAEKTKDSDTRDFIEDLDIDVYDGDEETVKIKLKNHIQFEIDKNDLIVMDNLEFKYPTLNNCIEAYLKIGREDTVRLQLVIYLEALKKYNDIEVDSKFRSRWGLHAFEKLKKSDINGITKALTKYGYNVVVEKKCNSCGKKFEVILNTSNFFGSALQSI